MALRPNAPLEERARLLVTLTTEALPENKVRLRGRVALGRPEAEALAVRAIGKGKSLGLRHGLPPMTTRSFARVNPGASVLGVPVGKLLG